MTKLRVKMPRRFWMHVDIKGEDDCWNWTGFVTASGHGRFTLPNRRFEYCHRYALLGDDACITEGSVLHACNNPRCVNPAHLYLGTRQDNMRDRKEVDSEYGVLTDPEVCQIRQLLKSGYSKRAIGRSFDVSDTTIHRINNGTTYKEVL